MLIPSLILRFLPLSLILAMSFCPGFALRAEHYSGVSSIAGLPFPEKDLPGVSLNHGIVELKALDTLAQYRLVLDFKNTTSEYQAMQMITPMRFYFNEFRPDLRAPMLERLADVFPTDFLVANPYSDTRADLQANFGKRLFIRKFVTTMDLARLGIACQAEIAGTPLSAKKIFLEFRWVEPVKAEWQGTGRVLCMEVRVQHEVLIKPGENRTVEMRLKLPSLITGKTLPQHYAPFELAGPSRWDGNISQLFLVNNIHEATLAIPATFGHRRFQEGLENSVTLIENLSPRNGDRIAFYNRSPGDPACDVSTSEVSFPSAVRNISASSYLNRPKEFPNLQVEERSTLLLTSEIPEYEHLSGFDLTLLAAESQISSLPNPAAQRITSLPCNRPEGPAISIDGYCHPVFAFDLGPEQGFQMQTAWCEDAAGPGKGEYLRFELTQPAHAMHVHNGYQFNDEKYAANNRLRTFTLKSEDGRFSKVLPVTDLRILNLYDLDLQPGFYTLTVEGTYDGTSPTACLSALYFEFTVTEPWFRQNFRKATK